MGALLSGKAADTVPVVHGSIMAFNVCRLPIISIGWRSH